MYDTSIELLQALKGVPNYKMLTCNTENESEPRMELVLSSVIKNFKKRHTWPVTRDRLKHFSNKATGLPDLRLSSSDLVNHIPIPITGGSNKDNRHICPMCVSTKGKYQGKTSFQCCICKIPLCTRIHLNENYNDNDPRHGKTHFEVWHSVRNLIDLNNSGIHKLSNYFMPIVSPTKEKRVSQSKETICKRKRDTLIELYHPSYKNGIELNKMGNHQHINYRSMMLTLNCPLCAITTIALIRMMY